ncbi:MAG: sugar phosphate nucleotidyltransferase, partial [Chitinophagaceae bacterium]
MKISEVIILAGGLGTRLREAVPDLPKCLAPVGQQPFLDHVIRYYQQQGVERFIFSLGYLHEKIEHYLQEKQPALSAVISLETEPLGTGGAIRKACALCTQPYSLVVNGDTLFQVNVQQIAQACEQTAPDCLLCVKPFRDFDRYGVVELNTDGTVRSFLEK